MASRLVHLSLDLSVWVQAMAEGITLCSWARHYTLTVPLSTQVYKRVPTNLYAGGTPAIA